MRNIKGINSLGIRWSSKIINSWMLSNSASLFLRSVDEFTATERLLIAKTKVSPVITRRFIRSGQSDWM